MSKISRIYRSFRVRINECLNSILVDSVPSNTKVIRVKQGPIFNQLARPYGGPWCMGAVEQTPALSLKAMTSMDIAIAIPR